MVDLNRRVSPTAAGTARDGQGALYFGAASRRNEIPLPAPPNPTLTLSPPAAPPNAPPLNSTTSRPISRSLSQESLFSVPPTTFFGSAALSTAPPFHTTRARATSDAEVFNFRGLSGSGTGVNTSRGTPFTFGFSAGVTTQPSRSSPPQPPSSLIRELPRPSNTGRAGSAAPVFTFEATSDSGTSVYTPSSTQFTLDFTPSATPRPSQSPSPEPLSSPLRQLPLPSLPGRALGSDQVASRSSRSVSTDGASRSARQPPSLSPISRQHAVQGGTITPRGRSPSLGVDLAGLSVHENPPDSQSPRERSPSLGVDFAGLFVRENPQDSQSPRERSPSLGVDISGLSLGENLENLTPYDVDSEEMPPHQVFSTEFQRTLQEGANIAQRAVAVIDRLTGVVGANDTLSRLRGDAQRLSGFRPANMKTIAVLGDSGEGKSSLINCLLSLPGLANTGDIGSACTTVVTEYHQKEERHSAPISIEVECMPQTEIEGVLSELLWSYRQLYLPGTESSSTPEADYARYMRESAEAWSALEAAFSHRPGFREAQFREVGEGSLERNTACLVEWSREIQWPEGVVNGRWASTAESAEECCRKTQLFMKDQYWPFTKAIRVYVDAQVLRTGVVLADLPGLQDTNLARVKATQDYMMRCDNIFIVANINRAITDQSLRSSLFTVFAQHVPLDWEASAARSLNIAVVCTKSDNIDLVNARREFCGPENRVSPAQMASLDREIQDARSGRNEELKKELKLRHKLLFIDARNEHVKTGLRDAYRARAQSRELEVFCVSNKLYDKYAERGNAEAVHASGIPAVRRFCHAVSADVQFSEAKHYLQSSLFSLNTQFGDAVLQFRDDFDDGFRGQIQAMMLNRQPQWERAAADEARKWEEWYQSQYHAWCLNNGNHRTPKREAEDWNAKIVWKMRSELDFSWEIVQGDIPEQFSTLSNSVREILVDLKRTILDLFHTNSHGLIVDAVESARRRFSYNRNLSEQRFTQEVQLVRRYASESSHNSYVLGGMLPTYRTAKCQFGDGREARQHAIIGRRIDGGELFSSIVIAITEHIAIIAEVEQGELRAATRDVIEQIRGDLDLVLTAPRPQEEEERSAESTRRLEELAGAVEGLMGDVRAIGQAL